MMSEERKRTIRAQAKLLTDEPLASIILELLDEVELQEKRSLLARRCLEEARGSIQDFIEVLFRHERIDEPEIA